jgi:hypothetical protein
MDGHLYHTIPLFLSIFCLLHLLTRMENVEPLNVDHDDAAPDYCPTPICYYYPVSLFPSNKSTDAA